MTSRAVPAELELVEEALLKAVRALDVDVVKVHIDNPNVEVNKAYEPFGNTLLHELAADTIPPITKNLEKVYALVELILEKGGDPFVQNKQLHSPFGMARYYDQKKLLDLFKKSHPISGRK